MTDAMTDNVIHPIGTRIKFKVSGRESIIYQLEADPQEVRYATTGSAWHYFPEDFEVIGPPTPETIAMMLDFYNDDMGDDGKDEDD